MIEEYRGPRSVQGQCEIEIVRRPFIGRGRREYHHDVARTTAVQVAVMLRVRAAVVVCLVAEAGERRQADDQHRRREEQRGQTATRE